MKFLLRIVAFTLLLQAQIAVSDILQKVPFEGKLQLSKEDVKRFPKVLINGRPAQENEFPGLVQIFSGGGSCSGQVTGKNSLMTAAHCVPSDTKTITAKIKGVNVTGTCLKGGESVLDVAVCKLSADQDLKFINVPGPKLKVASPKKGQIVMKSGYGCITVEGTGGNDGILRIGNSVVVQEFWKDGKTKREQYIESEGMSTVCFGDSGGAALYNIDSPFTKMHVLIGINSRVYTDENDKIINRDILLDVAGSSAQVFIKAALVAIPGLEICGQNVECLNGENPIPQAPAPPSPGPDIGQCLKLKLPGVLSECGVKI